MTLDQPVVADMSVWAVPASPRSTWVMVHVQAAGLSGFGELSDGGPAAQLVRAGTALREKLLGCTVDAARTELRHLAAERRRAAAPEEAFFWSTVFGGVDSALADLTARLHGLPLSESLGLGAPAPVRAYANINRRFGALGAEAVTREAVRAAETGYAAVKIAPFSAGDATTADAATVRRGLNLVARVREALPAGTRLMVDCHHRVPGDLVGRTADALAAQDVYWVEDLADITDAAALRAAAGTGLPLAAGEHVVDPAIAARACGEGLLSYWLLDPKHAGGPEGAARIAEAVRGTMLTFHNPSGPVGTAHAVHLAGLAGRTTWLEVAWGEDERDRLLDPGETITGGAVVPAAGPGIAQSVRQVRKETA